MPRWSSTTMPSPERATESSGCAICRPRALRRRRRRSMFASATWAPLFGHARPRRRRRAAHPGHDSQYERQLRILPSGEAVVLSTHDQVLGGERGQTFVACRFPAARAYAAAIAREAREAREAGDYLAEQGLVGRVGVDVVVARHDGGWHPYAVEMNLREGGTSHAYETLWLLTGGSLDQATMTFRASSG